LNDYSNWCDSDNNLLEESNMEENVIIDEEAESMKKTFHSKIYQWSLADDSLSVPFLALCRALMLTI